jgi:hypothetical protein
MATVDKAALEAELLEYQLTLKKYLKGEVATKYVIGTGVNRREYGYNEINEQVLIDEINRLKRELIDLEPEASGDLFRKTHHRVAWSKK